MLRNIIIISVVALLACPLFAQQENTANWTVDLGTDINSQKVTPLGILLAGTNEGLTAIDPENGEILWENKELKNLNLDSYSNLGVSPYFKVGNEQENAVFMNVTNGKVIVNTQDAGYKYLEHHFLPEQQVVLIAGESDAKDVKGLHMYDLSGAKLLWDNYELLQPASLEEIFAKAMSEATETDFYGSLVGISGFRNLPGNDFLINVKGDIYRMNTLTGDIVWKADQKIYGQYSEYRNDPFNDNRLIVGAQHVSTIKTVVNGEEKEETQVNFSMNAIDLTSGKTVFKENKVAEGGIGYFFAVKDGVIMGPRNPGNTFVQFFRYSDGECPWGKKGKGVKTDGSLMNAIPLNDNEYVVTTEKTVKNFLNNNDEPRFFINVLNTSTGEYKFDKFNKLKGLVRSVEVLDKGILYITELEIDMLDKTTGDNLLSTTIEGNRPVNMDRWDPQKHSLKTLLVDDNLYAFSNKDNSLYRLNKANGELTELNDDKIKLDGNDYPNTIEMRNDHLYLLGDQNIMKFTKDGSLVFHKYYESPSTPGVLKVFYAAQAAYAAMVGTVAGMYSAAGYSVAGQSDNQLAQEIGSEVGDEMYNQAGEAFGYSGQSLKKITERFRASADSKDYVFMLAQLKDVNSDKYGKKDNGLLQVNKDDGEISSIIFLGDEKDPVYEVDEIGGKVFLNQTPTTIAAYSFN